MQIKSIYVFEDITSTGIDLVPVASIVQVNGGTIRPTSWYYLQNSTGLSASTTIAAFLSQETLYSKVGTSTEVRYDYATNDIHFKIKG